MVRTGTDNRGAVTSSTPVTRTFAAIAVGDDTGRISPIGPPVTVRCGRMRLARKAAGPWCGISRCLFVPACLYLPVVTAGSDSWRGFCVTDTRDTALPT